MILQIALLFIGGQSGDFRDIDYLYELQKEIREKRDADFFDLLKNKAGIKKAINNTGKIQFFHFFLKKTLNDLETFEKLTEIQKKEVIIKLNELDNAGKELLSKTREERVLIYNDFEKTGILIRKTFGEGSYMDIYFSQQKFFPLLSIKNIDINQMVLGEIKRLEKSGWKDSPYNDIFYVSLVANAAHFNRGKEAVEYAEKFKEMRMQTLKTDDGKNLAHIAYLMQAYSINNKHKECIDMFKKINEKWLIPDDPSMGGAICRVYSSYARSLFGTNKKREAAAYQELSLSLQAQFYNERKNESVEKEALFLRTILADLGEWKSLRNLEERYYLKPLPKNPAEK